MFFVYPRNIYIFAVVFHLLFDALQSYIRYIYLSLFPSHVAFTGRPAEMGVALCMYAASFTDWARTVRIGPAEKGGSEQNRVTFPWQKPTKALEMQVWKMLFIPFQTTDFQVLC